MIFVKAFVLCCLLPLVCGAVWGDDRWDLVIQGGRLVDGTGARIHAADIAIHQGKIVEVGNVQKPGKRTLDARGYWVTPGFIDMHSHSELTLVQDGRALSSLFQGVTLLVLGEHSSAGPLSGKAEPPMSLAGNQVRQDWKSLSEYFARLEKNGIALNVASYVSSGQVRSCVVGYENRRATADELKGMKDLVARAMEEGAIGLSSGLSYVPDAFSSTSELIDLARIVAARKGIYATHLRSIPGDPLAGLRECLRIAETVGIGIEIQHIHSTAADHLPEYIEMIEAARKRGLDIEANVYPYTAGMSFLRALLPEWAQEGGTQKMLGRLRNPEDRQKIVDMLRSGSTFNAQIPWDRKVLSSANPSLDGKSLAQLARERNKTAEDTLVEVLSTEKGEGLFIAEGISEQTLIRALKLPWVNAGSDGAALSIEMKGAGKPHPRFFGTFPRLLQEYSRTQGVVPPEEMIRKMTTLPANRLNMKDRGKVAPGMAADLAIFHPEQFRDLATFNDPAKYSTGVRWLLVNGVLVIDEGKYTSASPGKVIRGPAYKR